MSPGNREVELQSPCFPAKDWPFLHVPLGEAGGLRGETELLEKGNSGTIFELGMFLGTEWMAAMLC